MQRNEPTARKFAREFDLLEALDIDEFARTTEVIKALREILLQLALGDEGETARAIGVLVQELEAAGYEQGNSRHLADQFAEGLRVHVDRAFSDDDMQSADDTQSAATFDDNINPPPYSTPRSFDPNNPNIPKRHSKLTNKFFEALAEGNIDLARERMKEIHGLMVAEDGFAEDLDVDEVFNSLRKVFEGMPPEIREEYGEIPSAVQNRQRHNSSVSEMPGMDDSRDASPEAGGQRLVPPDLNHMVAEMRNQHSEGNQAEVSKIADVLLLRILERGGGHGFKSAADLTNYVLGIDDSPERPVDDNETNPEDGSDDASDDGTLSGRDENSDGDSDAEPFSDVGTNMPSPDDSINPPPYSTPMSFDPNFPNIPKRHSKLTDEFFKALAVGNIDLARERMREIHGLMVAEDGYPEDLDVDEVFNSLRKVFKGMPPKTRAEYGEIPSAVQNRQRHNSSVSEMPGMDDSRDASPEAGGQRLVPPDLNHMVAEMRNQHSEGNQAEVSKIADVLLLRILERGGGHGFKSAADLTNYVLGIDDSPERPVDDNETNPEDGSDDASDHGTLSGWDGNDDGSEDGTLSGWDGNSDPKPFPDVGTNMPSPDDSSDQQPSPDDRPQTNVMDQANLKAHMGSEMGAITALLQGNDPKQAMAKAVALQKVLQASGVTSTHLDILKTAHKRVKRTETAPADANSESSSTLSAAIINKVDWDKACKICEIPPEEVAAVKKLALSIVKSGADSGVVLAQAKEFFKRAKATNTKLKIEKAQHVPAVIADIMIKKADGDQFRRPLKKSEMDGVG